jgi:hypothetical protein
MRSVIQNLSIVTPQQVTTGVGSGIGLTKLIGLDRTDLIELTVRQDGCLARKYEGRARKNGRQSKGSEG